jgi:hypothetical protein
MNKSENSIALQSIVEEIEASYWVPLLKTPFEQLAEIEKKSLEDCMQLHHCIAAFRTNLLSAQELLEFPYLLIAPFIQSSEASMPRPHQNDREELIKYVISVLEKSKPHLVRTHDQLQRLMHQACLLTWSAVEIFSKQVFIESLNKKPQIYSKINKNQSLKDHFGIGNATWSSLLESHEFNLEGKLGNILAANKDFSSPQIIKELIPLIFSDLSDIGFPKPIFKDDSLWKLGQQRHLIAHKCGIVDEEYIKKTKDKSQEAGKPLKLRGKDIAEAMGACASFAILLYGNARNCWEHKSNVSHSPA